jgi:hypothetical protein
MRLVVETLSRWRKDLSATFAAAINAADEMETDEHLMPRLECVDAEGFDLTVSLIPKNWPAIPFLFRTKTSMTLEELHKFVFDHYHVSPVRIFAAPKFQGSAGAQPIVSQENLTSHLRVCCGAEDHKAEFELQMAGVAMTVSPRITLWSCSGQV